MILFSAHLCFLAQTDGSVPNTLVIANCEVVKPRVAAAEHIAQVGHYYLSLASSFHIEMVSSCYPTCLIIAQIFQFNEEARSPFVKKYKTIIHPGEVSVLSSCTFLFLSFWSTDSQNTK